MTEHQTVSRKAWLARRRELLAKEKELTRLRDQLSRERRALPWVKVDKDYIFDGPEGKERLADLFAGRRQLIVQHFMFDPSWEAGCKSCSFWADNFNAIIVHLNQRDVSMVAISKAAIDRLQAFKARMGWSFKWLSSLNNDFNRDYHVSFTEEERQEGKAFYNYAYGRFPASEAPGLSVFYRAEDGTIFHTYSCYARGLDALNSAYQLLDLVPKGRDEGGLPGTMTWVRHHDLYTQ
jgi:predicted dithiol-disulfide oxidoreductase (DUF899 family)